MNQSNAVCQEARALLLSQHFGVLSTLSRTVSGYPFGSVVPYCLNRNGQPVILISNIAEHTKNIKADPRVSLTILKHDTNNVQENARLTLLADASEIMGVDDDTAERYYRHFPQSRDYHKAHNFSFYRIATVRIRYIGGFGNIHWLEPEEFIIANPFSSQDEKRMIEHMNDDHQTAMRHYLSRFKKMHAVDEQKIALAGIDAEGFDLLHNKQLIRFHFTAPVHSTQAARESLVAMAKPESI